MSIAFTQFLMPDGRKRQMNIDRPPEIELLALELSDAGHRFEIEMLTTGEVSMTVEADGEDGAEIVRSHKVCPNGPPVTESVDEMMTEAHANWQSGQAAY